MIEIRARMGSNRMATAGCRWSRPGIQ